ncbi:MAG: tRNA (adenine-N1)-methyltransferase [Anaerolineales bacterium]
MFTYEALARPGDLALLVGERHKHFLITLTPGMELHTHRGIVRHDDLIGLAWGSRIITHLGVTFYLLQPSLADLLLDLPRTTQILYPKDIGFILVTMGIGPGKRVIEAGSGSGALTIAFAYAVGPQGKVYSYEVRPEMQALARKNVSRLGLADRVEFKLRDLAEGCDETDAEAFFLDVPNPWDYIAQVRAALQPGGFFGSLVPTANQVTQLLDALRQERFAFIEVCEILLRYYKPEPQRLRPTDRMVAHTGYLIFARKVEEWQEEEQGAEEQGETVQEQS